MPAALYSDYMDDLRALIEQIDGRPDDFRTLDVHIELAHKGMLFVYETKKGKGQTDSIYYARMASSGANKQISQKTAFDAVSAFMKLGQFVALTGEKTSGDGAIAGREEHPSCAVAISYRKTGMPSKRSMKMIFLGFPDDEAALAQGEAGDIVTARPHGSERVWEWKQS